MIEGSGDPPYLKVVLDTTYGLARLYKVNSKPREI